MWDIIEADWCRQPRSGSLGCHSKAVCSSVSFHVLRFTQQLRQQHQLAEQLYQQVHQSELAALKAQINPHFLFNALNTLSASVPPALEPTRALIAQLAHTFRFALDASRHE